LQGLLLGAALVAAIVIFAAVTNFHYPLRNWLAWRYLWVSTLALVWMASCVSAGLALLHRLRCTVAEEPDLLLPLAFPLGVLAFQLGIFVIGLGGLLNAATFVLLPVLFLLAGHRRLLAAARGLRQQLSPPRTFPELGLFVLGIGGLALLYFQILSPEPFHWDARWYHLPIAQQYAVEGAIRPSPEGWWLASQPHSASLIYTWAFLLPASNLFDRLELCAHLELAVFLGTIASIPALVRQLAPAVPARLSWAAIFLFPGIFLYDSNLSAAADHIAALWSVAIALSLLRLWKTWQTRDGVLFGAFMGAAVTSKYATWSMLVFPGLVVLVRALGLAAPAVLDRIRKRSGRGVETARLYGTPFWAAVGVALLVSATFWLKNWAWYGDPLYPVLHRHLAVHPWNPEAPASLDVLESFLSKPRPSWQGLWDALVTTLTFSFMPNDWPVFHRNVPVFGSLFTLSMLCLPFIRAGARLWLAYLAAMISIIVWYFTSHQDRYLQIWLPWMVAATAATLGLVWQRRQIATRALVVALVALQVIWGADVPFFPTHNLIHDSSFRLHANFVASGFLRTPHRLRPYNDVGEVGENLPRDARLLVHESNMTLGLGVRLVQDQWQGRLSYVTLGSPAAIHRELQSLEVTHVLWETGPMSPWNSVGSDLAFLAFALNHTEDKRVFGKYALARFPTTTPAAAFNDRVAMVSCGSSYRPGLYRLGQLTVPAPGKPWAAPDAPLPDLAAAAQQVGFFVVEPACAPALPAEVAALFHPPMSRPNMQLYVRRM
jgi:hypothetical protein